jgi:Ca2+-binding RTX toxin-like protein
MPTYTGTAGNDTLAGSTGSDTLIGGFGNDSYVVNHLGDVVVEEVGAGVDTVSTSVLDYLSTYSLLPWRYVENLSYTGTLAAQLKGNAADNIIKANSAVAVSDTLWGAAGNDTLFGYGGTDLLMGGSGSDVLDGGAGADTMVGGVGDDTFYVDSTADRVYEYRNGGFDTIVSAVAKDLRFAWTQFVEGLVYTGTPAATLHGNAQGNAIESRSVSNDTLFGYAGNDTLDGGAGTDSMVGGLGDDFFHVSATDIVVEAVGEGRDTLYGLKTDLSVAAFANTVENLFYTGTSSVYVKGNALDNVLSGGSGNDTVAGFDGNDSVLGGSGADSLVGGNGDDFLYGGSAVSTDLNQGYNADQQIDTLVGGNGNDRYLIDSAIDRIVETTTGGFDVVVAAIDASLARYDNVEGLLLQPDSTAFFGQGSGRNDVIVGNEYDNLIVGGAGNDTLTGSAYRSSPFIDSNSDVVDAGAGNDVLVATNYGFFSTWSQEVSLFGGTGDDLYVLGLPIGSYGGQDSGGKDTALLVASGSIDNLEGVENAVMYGADADFDNAANTALAAIHAVAFPGQAYTPPTAGAFDLTGNELANILVGNRLNNAIVGGAGNDSLYGGAGNDTLEGGDGTDSLDGGLGDDTYYLDSGDVVVEGAGQGFDILASMTITSLTGYANVEGLWYLGARSLSMNAGSGNTSNDYFGGGSGNDTLAGFGGNDTLDGYGGNDRVDGGDGNDQLTGGAGVDTLLGGAGGDRLDGGDGDDSVEGGADNDVLYGGLGADLLQGGDGSDDLYGGASNGNGDDAGNGLSGGNGNDGLYGSAFDDELAGDAGDDRLDGGFGNDTLDGGEGNDVLIGDAGNDVIYGASQTRTGSTYSGYGDVLWGDQQYGDGTAGADRFVFGNVTTDNGVLETYNGSGQYNFNTGSIIADFVLGSDLIVVAKDVVGDGDALLENVQVKTAATGTFSAAAEMVIFRTDVAGSFNSSPASLDAIDAQAVAAVIGSAGAPLPTGAARLFVVDNGFSSALFQFYSADGNARVTIDELYLVTVVNGHASLNAGDFALFG